MRGVSRWCVALFVGVVLVGTTACRHVDARVFRGAYSYEPGSRLLLVGDPQPTSLLEVWRERNDAERELIADRIAEERPSLLVFLGDLVFDGPSSRHWRRFDETFARVHDADIPALAVLGNHEYWIRTHAGLPHFDARFPHQAGERWTTRRFGPLALVLLNTNARVLSDQEWAQQAAWFAQTLDRLDGDPGVRGVLVLGHHPPFTNSDTTGDEVEVQRAFVPAIVRSRKTLAYVSGHAHTYERFAVADKTFLVSGGGGGPRVKVLQGAKQRHPDRYDGPAKRPFNYLTVTPGPSGVDVRVTGLRKGETTFFEMERLSWPWRE